VRLLTTAFGLTTVNCLCNQAGRGVERRYDGFEVRDYAPYLVAEVVVPGPAEEAGNQGFRILAGYIFGKNKGDRKMAMTAPVTQAPVPAKIEMTAPVTQAPASGGYVVQFTMPGKYTLATLPEPLDPRVKLKEVPGGRFAVIRYSGTWSQRNYQEHLDKLERGLEAAGLSAAGSPIYSRYNAPYMPWFMRRNEIWLKLL
jgi:SOUL heme-binding protein